MFLSLHPYTLGMYDMCWSLSGDLYDHPAMAYGDDNRAKWFHQACDGLGPTLTLIELKNGMKIGAYSPMSWLGSDVGEWGMSEERRGWLVNLNSKQKANSGLYSTYDHRDLGPTFGYAGSNYNLKVDKTMRRVHCHWQSNSYGYTRGELKSCKDLTGSSNAEVAKIEVWNLQQGGRHASLFGGNIKGWKFYGQSSVASSEDIHRITRSIKTTNPMTGRSSWSDHDTVNPVSGLWERCFDRATHGARLHAMTT